MTARTNAAPRILEILGNQQLSHSQICQLTGMSGLSVKSALTAMRKRGEVVKKVNRDGVPKFHARRAA